MPDGQFFRRRLAAHLLQHLAGNPVELVDRFDHVHRNADRACLIGDGAGDGLADPPGCIGRKLVATPVLELVDGLHQADVALLDQVQELQAAIRVLLRDGNHQPEIGLNHLLLGAACLGLADRHLAVDFLDLGNRQVNFGFDQLQALLGLLDIFVHLEQGG